MANRRDAVRALCVLPHALKATLAAAAAPAPIIDSHIHLFDKTRTEGAPWPPDAEPGRVPPQGMTALPARYRSVIKPFGVVGTVVVEASTRIEDNQWLLDQAARDTIIVGVVGWLDLARDDFGTHLERFRKNNLYRGIRHRVIDGTSPPIEESIVKPQFLANLKLLADAELSLDTFYRQPGKDSSAALVRITDAVPSLRLIVDHLPGIQLPGERAARDAFKAGLRELGRRPSVYIKLSEVVRPVGGKVSTNLSTYREWLDELWSMFGTRRVMFGSDWPQSESIEPDSYPNVMNVAQAYVAGKGPEAVSNVFWKNSFAAYRWVKRDPSQQQT
jgi:L-fuconolactonase